MKHLAHRWTADELARLPDNGTLQELVRGEIREMPPPGARHGSATMRLAIQLGGHVLQNQLGEVFAAETGFHIEYDPDTVRAPDCSFVRAERLPSPLPARYLDLAPDLAVETVSRGDRSAEVDEKVRLWLECGSRLVWVLDPALRTVTVHRQGAEPRILSGSAALEGEDVVPGFHLEVSSLWG